VAGDDHLFAGQGRLHSLESWFLASSIFTFTALESFWPTWPI
jgi:hypothetical protein